MDCDKITEDGYIDSDGYVEINMSSIFTRLIQEAGRWCESYAADLLVDIDYIRDCLKTKVDEWKDGRYYSVGEDGSDTIAYVFGFRKSGVDHREWIEENQKDEHRKYHYYRAIWDLVILRSGNRVKVTLTKRVSF